MGLKDIFLIIGQTIKETILERLREAEIYGLLVLVDDVTDVAFMKQMVVFVSFINASSSRQDVQFLFKEDVLKDQEADGASAEVLINVLLKQLEHSGLKMENMMTLASDGASVRTGKKEWTCYKDEVPQQQAHFIPLCLPY